jgi:hypothetical protein
MNLETYIKEVFPDGLSYNETAQLCLLFYSVEIESLPEVCKAECNKDTLSNIFASLAQQGFLNTDAIEAPLYGANFHEVTDKGHWIEVIASIFKKGNTVNNELGIKLKSSLTRASI